MSEDEQGTTDLYLLSKELVSGALLRGNGEMCLKFLVLLFLRRVTLIRASDLSAPAPKSQGKGYCKCHSVLG